MFDFRNMDRKFSSEYRAFSVLMHVENGTRGNAIEQGNKVILPPSALNTLSQLNVTYPMTFKITNRRLARKTHCGVLEFSADEGKCFLPYWMMKNLGFDEGDHLFVENTQLPPGTFVKFQAQAVDFLEITNPKAVLEGSLRNFASLSQGETITIKYNKKEYELLVLETRPASAIDIHECDLTVEFAEPKGYKAPETKKVSEEVDDFKKPEVIIDEKGAFKPFAGTGNRVDGKSTSVDDKDAQEKLDDNIIGTGVPDYNWKLGKIKFIRKQLPRKDDQENTMPQGGSSSSAFGGEGRQLKPRKS